MKVRAIDPLRDQAGRFGLATLLLLGLITMMSLSGCNTISGAGEDVSAAGDAMSDTAEDVKEGM
jgi:entericidin B